MDSDDLKLFSRPKMQPSQKRQLKCWVSFWAKVGALFGLSMAGLALAAQAHRTAQEARARDMVALNSMVHSGQIRAWPQAPTRRTASVSSSTTTATISVGDSSTTVNIANPGGPGGGDVNTKVGPPGKSSRLALSASRGAGGTLNLTAPSNAGQNYVLEVSLDLRTWTTMLTNPATGSQIGFGISNSPALRNVYYRVSGTSAAMQIETPIFVSPVTGGGIGAKSLGRGPSFQVVTNLSHAPVVAE